MEDERRNNHVLAGLGLAFFFWIRGDELYLTQPKTYSPNPEITGEK